MSKFVSVKEIVNLPMLGSGDFLKRSKGRLLTWAPYVFDDMNLSVIRQAVREEFKINKRLNRVDLPKDTSEVCSVSVMDKDGVIWPLYQNDKIHQDIVTIPAEKDCACENKCWYQLCNMIKGYEAVQSVKSDFNPDGTPVSFNCVDRKTVDRNGFLYIQTQYPLRQYTNGVWTSTILFTEEKKLCELECDNNGCICDSDKNIDLVCASCGINPQQIPVGGNANCPPKPGEDKWIYYCNSKLNFFGVQCGQHTFMREGFCNIYNLSELGNSILFPPHFPFDKVIVRRYVVPQRMNLQVPFMAVDTFVLGLKWWDVKYDDKKQNLEQKYGGDYAKSKWGLFMFLNRYTLKEYGMMLAPPRHVPSYIVHKRHSDRY